LISTSGVVKAVQLGQARLTRLWTGKADEADEAADWQGWRGWPNSEALHKPFVKLCNVQRDSKAPWTRRGYKDREGRVRFVTGTRQGIEAHYVASGESPRGN